MALFDAIGSFLRDHSLPPDPANYTLTYRVLSAPDGPLARSVAALTEGGVRLTAEDLAALSQTAPTPASAEAALDRAEALVAQTRSQMEDFTGLVDRIRTETSEFGRDLTASVDALDPTLTPGVVGVAAAMLVRVRTAEAQLDNANREAATLRAELVTARDDARLDVLTGLGNRRALAEAFAAHGAAGRRGCLAICDIDHFKRINDRFGHAVGDRVLAAIAATLDDACPDAQVARYGGEEFAILFGSANVEEAVATLDRARATIAGKRYRVRDSDAVLGTITFSGGVVAVRPGDSLEHTVSQADALLYEAKKAGRNQVAS